MNFYNERRRQSAGVKPNAAHFALARLEAEYPGSVLTVTQNIDPLHEMAGSRQLIHMHGEIAKALCSACGGRHVIGSEALTIGSMCPACGMPSTLRPDVVWFGEMPYRMDDIYRELTACDLFISIGTSGTVYPAANFVLEAASHGAHTVELNLEPSERYGGFREAIHGRATENRRRPMLSGSCKRCVTNAIRPKFRPFRNPAIAMPPWRRRFSSASHLVETAGRPDPLRKSPCYQQTRRI